MPMNVFDSRRHSNALSKKDQFVSRVADAFFPLDVSFKGRSRTEFSGQLCEVTIGDASISRLCTSELRYQRTAQHGAREKEEYFLLTYVMSGGACFRQGSRDVQVAAGELLIEDSVYPYVFEHPCTAEFLALRLPRQKLIDRLSNVDDLYAKVLPAKYAPVTVLTDFLRSVFSVGRDLASQMDSAPGEQMPRLGSQILDLAAFSIDSSSDCISSSESSVQNANLRRVVSIINANLANPRLSVSVIARLTRLSPRYLHQLFQNTDTTLSKYIRERRLAECYRTLSDPHKKVTSIGELAHGWGFSDQGNFNRWFKAQYGKKPSQVRRSAREGCVDEIQSLG